MNESLKSIPKLKFDHINIRDSIEDLTPSALSNSTSGETDALVKFDIDMSELKEYLNTITKVIN